MSKQVVDLLTELGPVISSAGFITFLSALQVNSYMSQIVDLISSEVVKFVPALFDIKVPGARIIRILLSMLLAIAIIGLVYVFILMPIYGEVAKEVDNGKNDE